ncbi:MAG: DUF58 domain-containing protein [Haloarculaceae archaeon]
MTTVRRTNHWRGVVAVALLAGATGLLLERPAVLLAACVGVGYALYPRLRGAPTVSLAVERRLSDADPDAGDAVDVTVAVTNEGSDPLYDLRLVDGVPPMLSVADGTARHGAVLRPGETTRFAYGVRAEPGTHQFRGLTAIARDLSGSTEVETTVEAGGDEIAVRRSLPEAPVADDTDSFPGNVLTDESGTGVEFSRIREYRPGDDPGRIDWKRYARTGDLATVEYRQERTVSVLACVDARTVAYRGADGGPHAVSYAVAAAQELLDSVWDVDERAGLAAVGREFCWLDPGRGRDHEASARRLLLSHPALSPQPPDEPIADDELAAQRRELRRRLDPGTQLFLLSPLTDEFVVDLALSLSAADRSVTVVSPDVTAGDSLGSQVADVERRNRLHRLRRGDVRVVDWETDTSLARAVVRAKRRWSR